MINIFKRGGEGPAPVHESTNNVADLVASEIAAYSNAKNTLEQDDVRTPEDQEHVDQSALSAQRAEADAAKARALELLTNQGGLSEAEAKAYWAAATGNAGVGVVLEGGRTVTKDNYQDLLK